MPTSALAKASSKRERADSPTSGEDARPARKQRLTIEIPVFVPASVSTTTVTSDDHESLFGGHSPSSSSSSQSSGFNEHPESTRTSPPISGLTLCQSSIPTDLEERIISTCMDLYFRDGADQVMLFGSGSKGFPDILNELLDYVERLVFRDQGVPKQTYDLLFPTTVHPEQNSCRSNAGLARQAIINFYLPGEGISSHVDLLGRYGDGIIGVSLGSGCAMVFQEAQGDSSSDVDETPPAAGRRSYDVYLPPRSIIVMSGPARYDWEHGIEERVSDYVLDSDDPHGEDSASSSVKKRRGEWIAREPRMSVTYRWMLPGSDVVGEN